MKQSAIMDPDFMSKLQSIVLRLERRAMQNGHNAKVLGVNVYE